MAKIRKMTEADRGTVVKMMRDFYSSDAVYTSFGSFLTTAAAERGI